ncbi:MAG: inositol monophosphatase family protein [Pseudomonadota bacterium]
MASLSPAPEPGGEDAADRALLLAAAEAAGEIARRQFGSEPDHWEKSEGAGPVSTVDLEIDRMLRAELLSARPDYGWLSEESPESIADPARRHAARTFIVDPLDGTRAYLKGEPGFCHALAVVEAGLVVAGVVHLPMHRQSYAAHRGGGASLNDTPLVAGEPDGTPKILSSRYAMRPQHWPGGVPEARQSFRPALAHRLALVAAGEAGATLTFRPAWEWDIAAGAIIAEEAGVRVTAADGHVPPFNGAEPRWPSLLVAPPAYHAALLARLAPSAG